MCMYNCICVGMTIAKSTCKTNWYTQNTIMQDRNGFLNIFISVVLIFCDNHSLVKQSITDHPQDVLLHLSTFPEFPLHRTHDFKSWYIYMLPVMAITNWRVFCVPYLLYYCIALFSWSRPMTLWYSPSVGVVPPLPLLTI